MSDRISEVPEGNSSQEIRKGRKPYANYISARPVILPDGTYTHRTPRTFEDYCEAFGYGEDGEGLKGKKILDVGTGDSDFAHEARERNLTHVISVDADYGQTPAIDKTDVVVAFGQHLPFQDNSFNEVISSYMFEWLKKDDIAETLSEMMRVTEAGGLVKIYPARKAAPEIVLPEYVRLIQNTERGFQTLEIQKDSHFPSDACNGIFNKITQVVSFDMG